MKQITTLLFLFTFLVIFAQEVDKDSLKTEEVNIIKPYTPKIKDAFKIKKQPVIGNDEINNKKQVEYKINSAPVASTFTPSKGKAKGVAKKQKPHLFDNYISAGLGNYTTPKLEAFIHTSTTRDNDFGTKIKFHSSNGGITDIKLEDDFMDADIEAYYKKATRDLDWQMGVGYRYQKQNWYGLNEANALTDLEIENIDPTQVFNGFDLNGKMKYYDSNFKGVDLNAAIFTDAFNSSEFHFLAKPQFEFPVLDQWFDTDLRLEYIGGSFEKNYANTESLDYGFYNVGISPSVKINGDYFSLKLGAHAIYSATTEKEGVSQFFFYPNVTASYELIQDVVSIYAGVTGDLHQHSYQNFVSKNLYVSPTLHIARTNEQYNATLGTKGKLASNISFNINASYKSENAKPLYKLNEELISATAKNYQYANSFKVVYDNVKTLGFLGELTYDVSKEFSFGGNASFQTYTLDIQEEAWNLPSLEAGVFANYDAKKVIAGANLFLRGETKDQYITSLVTETITNKSYVDLNLNLGYRFTNRLSAFINANNLFGTNYQRFTNYKVQGIQVLGGIKYKFDL